MKRKHAYLVMAAVGFIGPYFFFISFLASHGLDGRAFLKELFGANISTFFAMDLVLSSIVFVRYLRQEAARCCIHHWWLYLLALLIVGLSFALPLFLFSRERSLESMTRAAKG